MKKIIAAIVGIAMIFTLVGCNSAPAESGQGGSSSAADTISNTIKINEFGINMSVAEFRTVFNEIAEGKYVISDFSDFADSASSNVTADIDIGMGEGIYGCLIMLTSDNDKIVRLSISSVCPPDNKEQYVEALSDIFSIIWRILYPDTETETLNSFIKNCRYSEEIIFCNDLYVYYSDSNTFGSDDRYISWTITAIEKYKSIPKE